MKIPLISGQTQITDPDTGYAVSWFVQWWNNSLAVIVKSIDDITGLQLGKQDKDDTLTALAALDGTAGLLEQTGVDAFAKRALGVAAGTSVPTRADADLRYQPLDSDLTAIAALTTTTFGRALLTLTDAAAGRTNYGATTVGSNLFTLANPGAITFPRFNADNSVSALDAATFRTAIGAGVGTGTVTSVAALTLGTTGTDLSSTVANGSTTPVITLNVPTASATNRGALSAADWSTFNGKQAAGSYALTNGTGATGTWGIGISGNAATATTSAACSGNAATATTATSATNATNITGGNQTGSYEVTSGAYTRFGHANQTNTDDGKIGAAILGASGLVICGAQTVAAAGRLIRTFGNVNFDSTIVSPTTSRDNGCTSGAPTARWSIVYAGTGTINTSDQREKVWRGGPTEAEKAAALAIKAELGFYQWNNAVAEKGSDARYHFGVKAQRAWEIMAEHGLVDPIGDDGRPGKTPYAFLCFDEWGALPADVDGDGLPLPPRPAGNRFGLRTDQLALFILAAL